MILIVVIVSMLSLFYFIGSFFKTATRKPAQKINVWLQWITECQSVPETGINFSRLKVFFAEESEKEFRNLELKKSQIYRQLSADWVAFTEKVFMKKNFMFWPTITHKIFETLVFMWNSAQREIFNFCFSEFSLVLTKLSFWQGD